MSTNQNQPAVGKCCTENLCKYGHVPLQDKICDRCKKNHIFCAKRMMSDNSLVCFLCNKLIRDEARREKRKLADAHRQSNESV